MPEVSRLVPGGAEPKRSAVELADVTHRALESALPFLQARRQVLTVDVPPAGLAVRVDALRLAQVVCQLLTKVARLTAEGGGIAVRARAQAGEAVLTVTDTGVRTPASEPPSTFTVRLPLHAPAPAPAGKSQARHVLVVDDNRDAATSLAEVLRIMGHSVAVADDGPAALALVQAGRAFDVALIDIGLPVMNGHELAQLLRERFAPSSLRLVALTGYGRASDIARSRDAGFDEHFVKPVDIETLLSCIAQAGGGAA